MPKVVLLTQKMDGMVFITPLKRKKKLTEKSLSFQNSTWLSVYGRCTLSRSESFDGQRVIAMMRISCVHTSQTKYAFLKKKIKIHTCTQSIHKHTRFL